MSDSTIVGWTGRGERADLSASVRHILHLEGIEAGVAPVGGCLLVEGGRPTDVAALLENLPGVGWVAVGRSAGTPKAVSSAAAELAHKYLRKGGSFAVRAESSDRGTKSEDLVGGANASILDERKGVRIDEKSPTTVFRISYGARGGAVGVELKKGPGGSPVGGERVHSLVSGGTHSSVASWLALLSGYQVELVHATVSEESLLEVARLYSELSHRVDPRHVGLLVLEGGTVRQRIAGWAKKAQGRIFSGAHAGMAATVKLPHKAASPLYILPEEAFARTLKPLGLKGYSGAQERGGRQGPGGPSARRFGGKRADVSGVLDGLR